MKPPVGIFNSYGGSLTLAATQEQHPILFSNEDHAFGIDSQRLNFPNLMYRDNLEDWPVDENLRDAIVIAHPPCSAFSSQNRGKTTRGPNASAFACTTRLLEYAMPREAEVIAIESVPGALEGAKHVHDHYAAAHGYDAYRVLQNAASFGVSQWRRRFWIIFVKRREGRKREFTFSLTHNVRYLGDVLPTEGGTNFDPSQAKRWEQQVAKAKSLGYSEQSLRQLLGQTEQFGNLIQILASKHGVEKTKGWPPFGGLHQNVVGGNFLSGALHVLDPDGFAPVLLGPAWWWFKDRMLEYEDYKQLMGFPRDYQYHKARLTTVLLSKGVCPPVARWILREVSANVFGISRSKEVFDDVVTQQTLSQAATLQPGEVANLNTPATFKQRKAAA